MLTILAAFYIYDQAKSQKHCKYDKYAMGFFFASYSKYMIFREQLPRLHKNHNLFCKEVNLQAKNI